MRRDSWESDQALITFKWKKNKKTTLMILNFHIYMSMLIISTPESSTNTQSEKTGVSTTTSLLLLFLLLLLIPTVILLSWCGGVQEKKKGRGKNSPGHLAEDLTCSLLVRGSSCRKHFFSHTNHIQVWRPASYKWKTLISVSLSAEVRAASNNPNSVLTPPCLLSAYTSPQNKINNNNKGLG